MKQSFITVFLFWCAFGFSAGPFWISVMQAVNEMTFKSLFLQFSIYQFFCWLPLVIMIGMLTGYLGEINQFIFIALHIGGMLVIFYLSYQIIRSKIKKVVAFKFGFKEMSILSITNPKVWVMLPIGAVGAQFSDHIWINSMFFYLIGFPIYFIGFFFWAALGRLGSKISLNLMSYINALLLVIFALYLGYQGILLII